MAWHLTTLNWLAHAAVAGSLCLLAGCVAVLCCRQPVRRLRLIELTLVGALLVPLLGRLPGLPHWPRGGLALLPAAPTSTGPELVATSSELSPGPAPQPPGPDVRPGAPAAPTEPLPQTPSSPASAVPTALPPSPTASAWPSFPGLLLLGYALVALLLLTRTLLGAARLARLCRTAHPVPRPVRELFQEITGPDGRSVRLLASDDLVLPLAFAGWRPVILLPQTLCWGGDLDALRYCLAHEWSHVERGDAWRWYLATLAQLLFFYQPLFWWLRRQLRLCQDYLADARAADLSREAEDYAEYLVGLARRGLGVPAVALGIGDRRSNLYRRITMLLHRPPLERRCLPSWNALVTLAAVAFLALLATVRLDAGDPPQEKKEPSAKEVSLPPAPQAETLHYTGRVTDKDTGKPIAGVTVTVRRSVLGDPTQQEQNVVLQETKHTTDVEGKYSFTIPPEQTAQRYLYIELDVEHPEYAPQKHFGYALSMIRKNEKLGGRPFFENVEMRPGQAVTGLVRTPAGEPAAGVKVMSYSVTDKRGNNFEYGSFADTLTDAQGHFRLVLTTPGKAVLWLLPERYAPSAHAVKDNKRGDLGTFTLHDGVRLKGKVLDARGQPLAGVNVNAESLGQEEAVQGLPVAGQINRSAVTDAKGEFEMAPLPPGEYKVQPDERSRDASKNDRTRRPVPAVFVGQKVALREGVEPVEVRARPHVTIEAHYVDGKGKPTRGHSPFVFGQMDGLPWFGEARADADGKIVAHVPHGLERVQLDLMTNEHGALRWRRGKDGTLHNNRRVDLGTLNDDVRDLEIVRYVAPIVIVKVTAKEGQKLTNPGVAAVYGKGKQQFEGQLIRADGRHSDVSFEHQEDGRWRSEQLFPDEETTVTGYADGYAPKSVQVKLREGETKEIDIVLDKAAEKKDAEKESKKEEK